MIINRQKYTFCVKMATLATRGLRLYIKQKFFACDIAGETMHRFYAGILI